MRVELQELTVKVLEVGELYALPHAENVGSRGKAVEGHPEVSSVEGRDSVLGSIGDVVAGQGVLDISPRGHDGAEHHQAEGAQSHGCD